MSIEPWSNYLYSPSRRTSQNPIGSTGVSSGSDRDSLAASPDNDDFIKPIVKPIGKPIGSGIYGPISHPFSTPYQAAAASFQRAENDFEESRLPIFRSLSTSDQ